MSNQRKGKYQSRPDTIEDMNILKENTQKVLERERNLW